MFVPNRYRASSVIATLFGYFTSLFVMPSGFRGDTVTIVPGLQLVTTFDRSAPLNTGRYALSDVISAE